MKKRNFLLAGILLTGALLMTGCSNAKTVRFGTAGQGGVYASFGDAFAKVCDAQKKGVKVDVKETAGSAANMHLLSEGYIQLGLAQSDLINEIYYAQELTGKETDSVKGFSAIAPLWSEAVQIIVPADSDIQDLDDLFDKTVSVGLEESGTERNAHQVLSAVGLNASMVKMVNYNYTDSFEHMLSGSVDAMFMTAGAPNDIIAEHASEIRFISLSEREQKHIQRMFDGYTNMTIPADTYEGMEEAVQTVGVQAVLLAADSLSDDTVHTITGILYDNSDALRESIPVKADLRADDATENVYIPFHPGALAWYEEHGIEVAK